MRGPLAHRSVIPLLLASLAFLASLWTTSPASAWTNATVRTASVEIALTPDGRADVFMRVRIRVDGGWLEGFDLDGLDEDATLDPARPVVFREVDGAILPARVGTLERGRISLQFTRRTAPRRGEYEIALGWTTALARSSVGDAGTIEARWILPAWRFGLDGVEIRWIVPGGSLAEPEDEITVPMETRVEAAPGEAGQLAIVYRRAHLPRTSAWETFVRVPSAAWPHAVERGSHEGHAGSVELALDRSTSARGALPRGAESAALAPTRGGAAARGGWPTQLHGELHGEPHDAPTTWLALGVLIVLASAWKRRDLERTPARRGRRARWLVPISCGAHTVSGVVALAVLVAAYALGWGPTPTIVSAMLVVLTSWQREDAPPALARLLPATRVSPQVVERARRERVSEWLAPSGWLEPSRLGLVLVGVAAAGLAFVDASSRVLLALFIALIVSGSRRAFGPSRSRELTTLARLARGSEPRLERPVIALSLLGRGATDPTDLRLRLVLDGEGSGGRLLGDLRAEIVVLPDLALRIAVRSRSRAETALVAWAAAEGLVVHESHGRFGVLCPLDPRRPVEAACAAVGALITWAPRELDATLTDPASDPSEGSILDAAE